ncbi:cytochrome P450 [Cladochytrium replicatum]|nr:cytochrome P450 [Cladochytrium replicatum]
MWSALLIVVALIGGSIATVVAYLHVRMYQRAAAFRKLNPDIRMHTSWYFGYLILRIMFKDIVKALGGRWHAHWEVDTIYERFLDTTDDVFALVTPFTTEVHVANADIIRQIALSQVTEFPKPARLYTVLEIFGPNILTLEFDEWKRHRRVAGPQFSERLNAQVVVAATKTMKQVFVNWGDEVEITLEHTLYEITMNVLGEAAFGVPFDQSTQEVLEGFTTSFQQCVRFVMANIVSIIAIPQWVQNLPLESTRKYRVAVDEFKRHLERLIKSPIDGNAPNGALLRSLVNSVSEEQDPQKRLTNEELISSAFIFLVAGHETTANTLLFALGMMAIYPEYQDMLLQETRKVLKDDEAPTYKHYSKLHFAHAIVNETLRLFPIVPFVGKHAGRGESGTETMQVLNGKYYIPSNGTNQDPNFEDTIIWLNINALQHNPKYWGDDVNQFRPERFYSPDAEDDQNTARVAETGAKVHKYAFAPFNVGPRACIGRKFALVEMAVILTLLNREYTWKPAPSMGAGLEGEDAAMRGCRTELNKPLFLNAMKPQNPINLVFTRRKDGPTAAAKEL